MCSRRTMWKVSGPPLPERHLPSSNSSLHCLPCRLGVRTILDPAPAQPLPRSLLDQVDVLTPNESEACLLLGQEVKRINKDSAPSLAAELLALGCRAVVLKLGDEGCFYYDGSTKIFAPAFRVKAVDSTAA